MPVLALTVQGVTEHLPDEAPHTDRALRRYWEASQAGDPTAKLVRVEVAPPPDDDPPPAAPAAALSVPSGHISAVAQDRIQLHDTWLADAGFAVPPPLFAPGTRVLPLGDQNFRLERQRVESLPPFPALADALRETVLAERREDLRVPLAELAMSEDGRLSVGGEPLGLEAPGFRQLATLAGFGIGARYLIERCEPSRRALNVNKELARTGVREVILRTRVQDGSRQIYAVVTPTYAPFDADRVLDTVAPVLADARAELVYDGDGIRGTALWMPDTIVDLAAGDIFKVGVRIETDDTGRGRIRITGVVFRNRCLNLMIIGEGEVETVNLVHRGDPKRMLTEVEGGVARARASISNFLGAWGRARTVLVDVPSVLREVADDKDVIRGTDEDRDEAFHAMLDAWRREEGQTLADAANAISRAAHETPDWSQGLRESLEREAARRVLVPA